MVSTRASTAIATAAAEAQKAAKNKAIDSRFHNPNKAIESTDTDNSNGKKKMEKTKKMMMKKKKDVAGPSFKQTVLDAGYESFESFLGARGLSLYREEDVRKGREILRGMFPGRGNLED